MNLTEIVNVKDLPGIYCIRNTINGKCYIGQSIFIRRRLKQHISEVRTKNLDTPLYRALRKYGNDCFEVVVLEQFDTKDYTTIKPKLDELEAKYIKLYDSYNNGYNQTVGGDGGIQGYKFTDAQKYKVKVDAKYTPGTCVYLYDYTTKSTIYAISISAAAQILGNRALRTQLSKHLDKCRLYKNYIICSNKDILTEEYIRNAISNSKTGVRKYTLDDYYCRLKMMQTTEYLPPISKIVKELNICKKTVCAYNKELRCLGKLITVEYHKNILN